MDESGHEVASGECRFCIPVVRNLIEYGVIIGWWLLGWWMIRWWGAANPWWAAVVIAACWLKTVFFGGENLRQLYEAARSNLAHHHFMLLMGINMSQMILSFALDFHLLHLLDPNSFSGVGPEVPTFEAVFDYFYLSTLNFSFFGYSDILPQTIPAKVANLTEIVLAFVTVIFLLSDFVSLKESLRGIRR